MGHGCGLNHGVARAVDVAFVSISVSCLFACVMFPRPTIGDRRQEKGVSKEGKEVEVVQGERHQNLKGNNAIAATPQAKSNT